MPLPVTAFVAAACALMLLITAIDTVRQRLRARAAFGTRGDARLTSASRSHGNLAEHAPIVIVMLGLLEMSGAHHQGLMLAGALFLIGRVAHIIGLYLPINDKPPLPRTIGVLITWGTLLGLAGWIFWLLLTRN